MKFIPAKERYETIFKLDDYLTKVDIPHEIKSLEHENGFILAYPSLDKDKRIMDVIQTDETIERNGKGYLEVYDYVGKKSEETKLCSLYDALAIFAMVHSTNLSLNGFDV